MKPKLGDVAKHVGVSPATVSRVLNNRGYISDKTRKRVNDSMKEIHYFSNEMARSLSTQKSNIIGLIFPTVKNPFFLN
ncbi:LacI family DNA-binding transcriptional regulator [Bacillus bingmayongensis]|uniref:LacI family DNA-binding transcriptional regulator n=1 Tax=Bacillus bingmayongensis TaxID=1150157 RepID=UPI0021AF09EE|nr:LacI family DNA-binding transcriptional regulator [Bacillus bingmayongensis]